MFRGEFCRALICMRPVHLCKVMQCAINVLHYRRLVGHYLHAPRTFMEVMQCAINVLTW